MKSTFWIVPEVLAGRAGPDCEPWTLQELYDGGIRAVLNVSEFEPRWYEFQKTGIEVSWIPFPNDYPATAETEETCLRLLPKAYSFLEEQMNAGRPTLVHCAWGRDRTGLLLAYHLVRTTRMTPAEAIIFVRHRRPKAITALGWEEMVIKILQQLPA